MAVHGSAVVWARAKNLKDRAAEREVLNLAKAIDAIYDNDIDLALEILTRRCWGVAIAVANSNGDLYDALSLEPAQAQDMPGDLMDHVLRRASAMRKQLRRQTAAQFTARRPSKASGSSTIKKSASGRGARKR